GVLHELRPMGAGVRSRCRRHQCLLQVGRIHGAEPATRPRVLRRLGGVERDVVLGADRGRLPGPRHDHVGHHGAPSRASGDRRPGPVPPVDARHRCEFLLRPQLRSGSMSDLTGHVALITGGNGGIGLGMATGLANAGADVAIWGTKPDKNEAASEVLAKTGRRVHAEVCDVSDEDQVIASFARTGDAPANAGTGGRIPAVTELSLADWRRVLAVNLDGAFLTLREGARHMVERGEGGALVAVASTSAIHGAPFNPHYAASKTGLLGLVRAL